MDARSAQNPGSAPRGNPALLLAVLVTAPAGEEGARIARILVEERLAACVNVLEGARSIYRWEGKIEDSGESLLVIKTSGRVLEALKARLREIHPYEVPELIALPIVGGLKEYLEWVGRESSGTGN